MLVLSEKGQGFVVPLGPTTKEILAYTRKIRNVSARFVSLNNTKAYFPYCTPIP
jgi:hypothetical protein